MKKYELPAESTRCLECGEPIAYGGRSDRKFCCDSCRNSYHNRLHHDSRMIRHRVSSSIEKNYTVLSKLLRSGITTMSLGDLAQMGFVPEFVTAYRRVGQHVECRCYDIIYYKTSTRIFSITRSNIV